MNTTLTPTAAPADAVVFRGAESHSVLTAAEHARSWGMSTTAADALREHLLAAAWTSCSDCLAQLAFPQRQVVGFAGEGGLTLSVGEVATCVKYQLPIICHAERNEASRRRSPAAVAPESVRRTE